MLIVPCWLQTMLLDLPPELLQQTVLPLLSLPAWGALRLTCRTLNQLAAHAPDGALHAAARHTLPSTHPLLGVQPRHQLALQRHVGQAIAAGPKAWHWQHVTRLKDAEPGGAPFAWVHAPSPDWTKVATTWSETCAHQVLVTNLLSGRQLLSIPVHKSGGPPPNYAPPSFPMCHWTDDSLGLFWSADDWPGCQLSYFHLFTHQQSDCELPTGYAMCPVRPQTLPGPDHALLLATPCPTSGLPHLRVMQASGSVCSCSEPLPQAYFLDKALLACSVIGLIAFPCKAASLCVWQPGGRTVVTAMPSEPSSLAWCPDGGVLLASCQQHVVFLSAEGVILAQQPLHALSSVCWGLDIVIGRRTVAQSSLCASSIETYALAEGPQLRLRQTLEMPWEPSRPAPLLLRPNWQHVAFAAGTGFKTVHLAVLRAYLPHSRGQPPAREQLGSQHVAGPNLKVQSSWSYESSMLRWQPGSTGIISGLDGRGVLLSFV